MVVGGRTEEKEEEKKKTAIAQMAEETIWP
jgi:hypothetical protein